MRSMNNTHCLIHFLVLYAAKKIRDKTVDRRPRHEKKAKTKTQRKNRVFQKSKSRSI